MAGELWTLQGEAALQQHCSSWNICMACINTAHACCLPPTCTSSSAVVPALPLLVSGHPGPLLLAGSAQCPVNPQGAGDTHCGGPQPRVGG
jgi:hypothetical protein